MSRCCIRVTILVLTCAAPSWAGVKVRFVDMASAAGLDLVTVFGGLDKKYIIEYTGTGAGFSDYDGDGDLDVYLVNGQPLESSDGDSLPRNRLYRNDGKARFTDVTALAGVGDAGWGAGCLFGDIDNDGDPDLLVTNYGPNVLFLNNGDGTFTDKSVAAGLDDPRWAESAGLGDLDADGFLDLYVTNHAVFRKEAPPDFPCFWKGIEIACGPLAQEPESDILYRNRGDGTFEDRSSPTGVAQMRGYGFGVVMDYFDDDAFLDVYVANDLTGNFVLVNRGNFTFDDGSALSGAAYVEGGREQAGMGVDSGDFDNDGRSDIYVTNFSDDYNTLYRNDGGGLFTDQTFEAQLGPASFRNLGWGTFFFDFDNDGDDDLFVANGHIYPQADRIDSGTSYSQSNQLFENVDGERFEEVSRSVGLGAKRLGRGAAYGDVDNDGDVDVLVANLHDKASLLRNDGGDSGRWVKLQLVGVQSNREGVGARVMLDSGGRRQTRTLKASGSYLASHDRRLHFGLGEERATREVTVRWPSGATDRLTSLEAGRVYLVVEGRGAVPLPRPGASGLE